MAKINISYDTNTKDYLVDINGQPLDGVREVMMCRYGEDDVEMTIFLDPVKKDGMTIHQFVRADKNGNLETVEDKEPIKKAMHEWLGPKN